MKSRPLALSEIDSAAARSAPYASEAALRIRFACVLDKMRRNGESMTPSATAQAHGIRPLRTFIVFYPDLPASYGKELWAAPDEKDLLVALNSAYPFRHTLFNIKELPCEDLIDEQVLALIEEVGVPWRILELYSPEPHPTRRSDATVVRP